jgi:hypothetical protein
MNRREAAVAVFALGVIALWVAILAGILPGQRGPGSHLPALNGTPRPSDAPAAVPAAGPTSNPSGALQARSGGLTTKAGPSADEVEDEPPDVEDEPEAGVKPPGIDLPKTVPGSAVPISVPRLPLPSPPLH